jgi:hypothetical protein
MDFSGPLKAPMRFAAVIVALSFLLGCGIPIPSEKEDYVGLWQAPNMVLLIQRNGTVKYKRVKNGATTTVEGPIQAFEGNDFVVGVWFIHTTFKVQTSPYQENGQWKMVVDGVELTRVRGPKKRGTWT